MATSCAPTAKPFLVSAIATATAAATATLHGWPGTDSLIAGWMALPSMAGAVSLAWWAGTGYVAFSLRRILHGKPRPLTPPSAQPAPAPAASPAEDVLQGWHSYISADRAAHPGNHLTLTGHSPEAWEGTIEARPGQQVSVTRETISGVYQVPVEQVHITPGPHASSRRILVQTVAPTVAEQQYSNLDALWMRRVGSTSGCMPGTHLEGAVPDPATGGVAAWIVADEDTDHITVPDAYRIAGALRTTTLLVSVEPTLNPRKAKLRLMDRSPLEEGKALPGPAALRANKNGFVELGTGISGRPSRIQIFDQKGGARHVLVAGVTGSGKGGALQLLALSYHVNGVAIIYADPKGSSNPDVEDMAAHAGCGIDGAMGALRLAYALLLHRVLQSQRLRMKNFEATDTMPFVAVVLDEFAQLLGDKALNRAEAAFIISAIAEQGRSLGMCLVLCGQILNLDKMGGDTAIRDNVFYGGALLLLRSDSAQKHRVDLPDAFEGADPSKIPPFWKGDDDTLIYDPDMPEDDPRRTFGVGYAVGPDERAEMMRLWILESAAGHYDPDRIVTPADFPDWEDRHDIALIPVGPAAATGADEDESGSGWMPAQRGPILAKEPTAQAKILTVLTERRDPIGLEVGYLHLDEITQITGVTRKTVENTVSRLTKDGTITRNPDASGEYGLPLTVSSDQ
ncbi:helicase HerA-like domain-containing protein [Streptacidiphilus sp. PAMC 29251]